MLPLWTCLTFLSFLCILPQVCRGSSLGSLKTNSEKQRGSLQTKHQQVLLPTHSFFCFLLLISVLNEPYNDIFIASPCQIQCYVLSSQANLLLFCLCTCCHFFKIWFDDHVAFSSALLNNLRCFMLQSQYDTLNINESVTNSIDLLALSYFDFSIPLHCTGL